MDHPYDAILFAAVIFGGASSCSTIAEPAEEGPPICDCDPGERKINCRTGEFFVATGNYNNLRTSDAYSIFCIDIEATDQQKEQACLDACNEWLDDADGKVSCGFIPMMEPFHWTACVPAGEDTDSPPGAGPTCPGWYTPSAHVTYEPLDQGSASVHIDRALVDQIAADLSSLYTCDSARYQEHEDGGWSFTRVEPSDLLHHLGLRSGDGIATVQGLDPATLEPTTAPHRLDSLDAFHDAATALRSADAVLLTVERPSTPTGTFDLQITLDR